MGGSAFPKSKNSSYTFTVWSHDHDKALTLATAVPKRRLKTQIFVSKMTLNQSSLFGQVDDLQDLTFIERPIRRSLKVFDKKVHN